MFLAAALLACPVAAQGLAGHALSFDGIDDYVAIPGFAFQGNALTVETWTSVRTFERYGRVLDFGGAGVGTRFTLQVNENGLSFNLDGAGGATEAATIPLAGRPNSHRKCNGSAPEGHPGNPG